jgi:hypothetical protein
MDGFERDSINVRRASPHLPDGLAIIAHPFELSRGQIPFRRHL